MARSAEGVEIIFKVQCYGNAGRRYEKNRFNHNTPSPLRGTSPILGEELFVLVNNELGALNSSPPGAGGVARSAEGVEIIFKEQCYGEAGRRYEKS